MESTANIAELKPPTRPKVARSRVTNGEEILPGVDGRSLIGRRYRDIAEAILADQGGDDRCSEGRRQLVRRFAAAAVLAEQMEADLANGAEISIERHALLVSSLVRLSGKLGLERRAKDITPTLSDYFRR